MNYITAVFGNLLLQLLLTVGVIAVCGILLALVRMAILKLLGRHGYNALLLAGVIGSPIHEISHALMCLIFFHQIKEIKLYQPFSEDGTLGYVRHTYDSRNIYQRMGNFYIGIAPIIVGTAVLFLLMFLLIPSTFAAYVTAFNNLNGNTLSLSTITEGFIGAFDALCRTANLADWKWWVFAVLALSISSHFELSSADIENSASGLVLLIGCLFIIDNVCYFFGSGHLDAFTLAISRMSLGVANFLMIAVIFSLVMLIIGLVVKVIVCLLQRR